VFGAGIINRLRAGAGSTLLVVVVVGERRHLVDVEVHQLRDARVVPRLLGVEIGFGGEGGHCSPLHWSVLLFFWAAGKKRLIEEVIVCGVKHVLRVLGMRITTSHIEMRFARGTHTIVG
jgi:hypothetical protein